MFIKIMLKVAWRMEDDMKMKINLNLLLKRIKKENSLKLMKFIVLFLIYFTYLFFFFIFFSIFYQTRLMSSFILSIYFFFVTTKERIKHLNND